MSYGIEDYRLTLRDSGWFSEEELSQIIDFYVSHSFSSSAQKRTLNDYGCKRPSLSQICKIAGIESNRAIILQADSMKKTLCSLGFYCEEHSKGKNKNEIRRVVKQRIDTSVSRFACLQRYSIADDDGPRAKQGDGDVFCLLRHIRNSLAHSNTFCFPDMKLLLIDRNEQQRVDTAWILIGARVLLDWIQLFDINAKYYLKDKSRDHIKSILEI